MSNKFEPLENGEVLSVGETAQILIGHRTFRAGEFSEAVRAQLEYGLGGWSEEKDGWFSEVGIPCEVLRFSAGNWQKGTVRIRLEFSPDTQNGGQSKKGQEESQLPHVGSISTPERDISTPISSDLDLDLESSIPISGVLTPDVVIPEDLDLEQVSDLNEEELVFPDLSESNEPDENQEADSLLDDVWQDMNQSSWQGSQY